MRLPNLARSTECWDTLLPSAGGFRGSLVQQPVRGGPAQRGSGQGTDGANSLRLSPRRSTISLQILCLRMQLAFSQGKAHTHHWSSLGLSEVGPKGVLSKGE